MIGILLMYMQCERKQFTKTVQFQNKLKCSRQFQKSHLKEKEYFIFYLGPLILKLKVLNYKKVFAVHVCIFSFGVWNRNKFLDLFLTERINILMVDKNKFYCDFS